MNKIEIGNTAGKVWRLLDDEGDLSIQEIKQKLKVSDPLLYMAFGWLCREDKIHCYEEETKFLLSKKISNTFFG